MLEMEYMTKVSVCADSHDRYNKAPFVSIQSHAGIICYDSIACSLVMGANISIMYMAPKILTAV